MKKAPLISTLTTVLLLATPTAFAADEACLEEVARIHNSEVMACYLSHGPKSDEFRVQNQGPLRSCLKEAKQQYTKGVYGKCNYADKRKLNVDIGFFSY